MKDGVSVIIPVGNSRFLRQAVESVLKQSQLLELIIVDDVSGIQRSSYLDKRIKIIKNKSRLGPAGSRNKGLSVARGRYVAFLDADDWWHQDFLVTMVRRLNDSSSVSAICLSRKKIEKGFKLLGLVKIAIYNLVKDSLLLFSFLTNKQTLHPSAPFLVQISHMIFDREKITDIGFDPKYNFCEDWKFVLEVGRRGSISIVPKRLITYRYSPSSNTMTIIKNKSQNKKLYYKRIIKKVTDQYGSTLYLKLFQVYTNNFLIKTL